VTSDREAYQDSYIPLFMKNYKRYKSLRRRIDRRRDQILQDPYQDTERLGRKPGGLDLRGCRSAPVGQNFRIVLVVCEECRRMPECQYCFCEGLPDRTVLFLTVGPHEKAYLMREAPDMAYG
jgi:hypothetical protein